MLNTAVVIATKGRPEVVRALASDLRRQTARPDLLLVSACDPNDVAGVAEAYAGAHTIFGPPGLPNQRNTALDALPKSVEVVIFLDDDFIPSRYWLERVRLIFAAHPDIAVVTGRVLADGGKTEGIPWTEGLSIVEHEDSEASGVFSQLAFKENFSPFGCNMAFRRSAIGKIRFDERLVLYGWQEDRDFGAQVGRNGRMVKTDAIWGVHLGTKGGRVPGRKLGYSQIVNPWYLVRKGTMTLLAALEHAGRNLVANSVRVFFPEPYIDRLGRLQGNLLGLWDIVTGRWRPERAAEL